MADPTTLVAFAKELKWENYIDDKEIHDALEAIYKRVQEREGHKPKIESVKGQDVNVADATRVKLVVVGDGAVGKTSLLIRYSTGEFPTDYLPTVFENYTAQLKRGTDVVLLHLWDTAGQEDYDRLRPLSYPGADVVLLCFSTINQASYEAIKEKWSPEVKHYIPTIPHLLIGTKIDLREAGVKDPNSGKFEPITSEQGQQLAKEIGAVKYLEVSSKTGQNLQEVFQNAVEHALSCRDGGTDSTSHAGGNDASAKGGARKKKSSGCLLL
jgi:small GTP-binding protein